MSTARSPRPRAAMHLSSPPHASSDPSRLRRGLRRWLLSLALLLAGVSADVAAQVEVTGFGSNPGNLRMFKLVPAALPAGAPLVVALHGCAQSAASYDAETGWQQFAERWKFALLLPQQQSANNASACFNWFESGDTTRGQGEALSIKQMVDRMIADHGIAPSRVYVTGLSAGGAMTAAMLATYPDVFAGGAIVAGLPYRCATTQSAAFSCMNPGTDLTPAQWGDRVRAASSWTGPWPRVSIWHGDADFTVRPANLTESMEQWTHVHGIDQTADIADTVGGYPHRVYSDAAGNPRVETYSITGMGHGVPVDPGTGTTQCGTAGAYILDVNLCASFYIGRFFGLDGGGNGGGPSVALTAPAPGAVLGGNVQLQAGASAPAGIARVDFLVDGAVLGSDSSAPYQFSWNSAGVADGAHTLGARALDGAGATTDAAPVPVTVNNAGGDIALDFGSEDANDGYIKANANGSAPALGTLESSYGLAIGRGSDGKYNRSLLSFDTSAIPDDATIVSATLTLRYRGGSGSPWSNPAGNTLVVDVRRGCYGSACTVEATDWGAAATALAVAQVPAFSSGTQSSGGFDASGLAAIDKTGRTQLRLRFSADQTATHYVWVDKGANATLRVVYRR